MKKKTDDFLEHFGIPGMHWGRRKSSGSNVVTGSKDHVRKHELKKKQLKDMTNEELRDFTTRLQLERQYKDLNRSDVSAGRKFLMDFVKNQATALLSGYVTKQISEVLKKV